MAVSWKQCPPTLKVLVITIIFTIVILFNNGHYKICSQQGWGGLALVDNTIGKWSLILPNVKLLPSHIRSTQPRENTSSVVSNWNRWIASHYLGVTISNNLKWSDHVSIITARANKSLGSIQSNLWNRPKNIKEIVYTSLVRLKLEYVIAAWDPFLKKDVSDPGKSST